MSTYARVDRFIVHEGHLTGIEFVDELSGEPQSATASIVMNAAGPWVDQVLKVAATRQRCLVALKAVTSWCQHYRALRE